MQDRFCKPPKVLPYLNALKAPSLDSSEFILLSTAILARKLADKFSEFTQIQDSYLNGNNKLAIQLILEVCDNYSEIKHNKIIYESLSNAFKETLDSPTKNPSRRYFETRCSSLLWSSLDKADFYEALQKFADFFYELNPELYKKRISEQKSGLIVVDTLILADKILISTQELADITPSINSFIASIKMKSPFIKDRDNAPIRGTSVKDQVYSLHPGIMKSIQPTPSDKLLTEVQKNRIVDSFQILPAIQQGYSTNRPHVPYVNSVSGTAFSLIIILELFTKHYAEDKNRERHIDYIIQGFVTCLCLHGYHSFVEILDVFHLPLKELMKKHDIKINPPEIKFTVPSYLLTMAFNDACEYAKKITLDRIVQTELKDKHEFNN